MADDLARDEPRVRVSEEGIQARDLTTRPREEDFAPRIQVAANRLVDAPQIARQILRATKRPRLFNRLRPPMADAVDVGLDSPVDDTAASKRRTGQRPARPSGGNLFQQGDIPQLRGEETRFALMVRLRNGMVIAQGGTTPTALAAGATT